MKSIILTIGVLILLLSFSSAPSTSSTIQLEEAITDSIKVYFLYGSKPAKENKATEPKWFGGKHGGHVGIEGEGDKIVSFLPTGKTHIFSKKDKKSRFVNTSENGFWEILGGEAPKVKKMIIHVPVNANQKRQIDSIHSEYLNNAPYDYAFFGMRCAAATYEILGQVDVVKSYSNSRTWKKIFYPKKLRTRLLKKAKANNWEVDKLEGASSRKWEEDKSKLE